MSRAATFNALRASLAAAMPTRHVVRGMHQVESLGDDWLEDGVLMVVSDEESDYANWLGGEGRDAHVAVWLVGYLKVPEPADADALVTYPQVVEDAEFAFVEQVLAWVGTQRPPPIDAVVPSKTQFSRGLEHPYGWFSMQAKLMFGN